jgi:rSAM/selenodomain-associated transferase 2
MVSIIIPTLNEASVIGRTLDGLSSASGDFEVLVADGQSDDATRELVCGRIPTFSHALRIVSCPRQRARQLNLGAEQASGSILMFLYADTEVPRDAIIRMEEALRGNSAVGGNFEIIFGGEGWTSRVFTWIYHVRRPFGIYYGDSGIFVRRETFVHMGGFKPIPIMDDYEFVRRLERQGKTVCVGTPLAVSDRRWRLQGIAKTLLSWISIQALFSLGLSPQRLARWYRPVRENGTPLSAPCAQKQETGSGEVS